MSKANLKFKNARLVILKFQASVPSKPSSTIYGTIQNHLMVSFSGAQTWYKWTSAHFFPRITVVVYIAATAFFPFLLELIRLVPSALYAPPYQQVLLNKISSFNDK